MMAEQTVLMTGATRGIGHVAARRVLAESPQSHLLVLARPGTPDVVRSFGADPARVSVIDADLASMGSMQAAAFHVAALVSDGVVPPIRVMALNGGVQHTNALTVTEDGFESTFAVNVLANHVLIRLLREDAAPAAHTVVTVSDTHFGDLRHNLGMVPGPRWADPQTLVRPGAFPRPARASAGRMAYSTSKLAGIYLVHAYSRHFAGDGTFHAYNPGFVPATGLAREAAAPARYVMRRIMPLLTLSPLATSAQRAGELLTDAMFAGNAAPNGAYIDRGRVVDSSPESYDIGRETELWDAVESLTAPFLGPDSDRQ